MKMLRVRQTSSKLLVGPLLFWLAASIHANPNLVPGVWTNITPPNAGSVCGIVLLAPSSPSTLYASMMQSNSVFQGTGIWKSMDAGNTWAMLGNATSTPVYSGTTNFMPFISFGAIDPNNPLHIYATHNGSVYGNGANIGFWISNDGGNTWTMPASFPPPNTSSDASNLAVDPADFNHFVIASHSPWASNAVGQAGFLESTDGGNTWIVHQPPASWTWYYSNRQIFILRDMDPAHPQGDGKTWLTVHDSHGVWRTTDAGNTWSQLPGLNGSHFSAQAYYAHTGTLFMGGDNTYASTDNGLTFTQAASGGATTGLCGDGCNLYKGVIKWSPQSFLTSPETDGSNWTPYNPLGTGAQIIPDGSNNMTFDKVNGIMYSANWEGGLWALKVKTCTTERMEQNTPKNLVPVGLTTGARRMVVTAPSGEVWRLELFSLTGEKLAAMTGDGTRAIAIDKGTAGHGFAMARLTYASGMIVEKLTQ